MTLIREIMSFGALTVRPGERLHDISGRLRRIGHEGYPVVDGDGRVIGLLTSRDINRADANGLGHLAVAAVMQAGNVTAAPNEPVRVLPGRMTDTGWGQIPVVEHNVVVGIVTRTDVIRFYAQAEATKNAPRTVSHEEVRQVLGAANAALIAFVAAHAATADKTIYMVGGVVRDLLMGRQNLDIDFVLEGDAIGFADSLAATHGGSTKSHTAFGTTKWFFDEAAAAAVGAPLPELPAYIDIVTARYEFYQEPAVLPTVYTGGIRLDLRRRDFTVNALAVQLSTEEQDGAGGTVLDLFGGLKDLEAGQIRALHSLSFADDPTRTLRAVRFAHRLGFEIEPRTASLIDTALPMMARVTGERLRNELTLMLNEPDPANGLLRLQEMGVLSAIHPQFTLDARVTDVFDRATAATDTLIGDTTLRAWLLVAICMPPDAVLPIGERLMFSKAALDALAGAAQLGANMEGFLSGSPSEITFRLEALPPEAVAACALTSATEEQEVKLRRYLDHWRHIYPDANGDTLKAMGLQPGPHFGKILKRLRAARIDGHIETNKDEFTLIRALLEESESQHDQR